MNRNKIEKRFGGHILFYYLQLLLLNLKGLLPN